MTPTRRLRFTGTLPTRRAVEQHSNWVLALEEEGLPGQDETTLRPDDNQNAITRETVGTAVSVEGPGGPRQLGMLYGYVDLWKGPERADWLHLFQGTRRLDMKLMSKYWWPDETGPTLEYNDVTAFPLRVTSVVPSAKTGKHLELTLLPSGPIAFGPHARDKDVAPSDLRVGSVPRGSRDYLADRAEGQIYSVQGRGQREIGSTTRVATISKGSVQVSYKYDKTNQFGATHITEKVEFDAQTIEATARSGMVNGRKLDFALGRRGRSRLPRGTFGDMTSLLQTLELSRGMRFVAPFFLMLFDQVRKIAFEVDVQEAAPGHRGSSAWRIRSEMGGPHLEYTWLDTRTRALLATRSTAREKGLGFDELVIYRR